MANHINRSKDPEVIVNTIIQSCDTEQIQVCVMRVPLSSSSDESEPMSVERRMISDEELADSKRLHNQIASVRPGNRLRIRALREVSCWCRSVL